MTQRSSSKASEDQHTGARILGELEFAVLQSVWTHEEHGEKRIIVSDILPDILRSRTLAYYSTIATVCNVLVEKHLLELESPINGEYLPPAYRSVIPRDEAGTAVIVQDSSVVVVNDQTEK